MIFIFLIAWLLLALIEAVRDVDPYRLLKIIVIVAALILITLVQQGIIL